MEIRRGEQAERPSACVQRAGGGGQRYSQSFWLWPLPPGGPFSFVCEWPALDIGLTRVEVDSALFREAAARTRTLWDDGRLRSLPRNTPGLRGARLEYPARIWLGPKGRWFKSVAPIKAKPTQKRGGFGRSGRLCDEDGVHGGRDGDAARGLLQASRQARGHTVVRTRPASPVEGASMSSPGAQPRLLPRNDLALRGGAQDQRRC